MTRHGLRNHEIAVRYMLGYVGKPLTGDDIFRGMLAIPYLTEGGVKAIKFRRLRGEGPKYAQHEGQETRLFNTNVLLDAGDIIGLTEGEIDAITATEILGVPTVGYPGARTWEHNRKVWTQIFKDFSTIFVFADGDKDGREAAGQVRGTLGWDAHVIWCPPNEDVSSLVFSGKTAKLRIEIDRVLANTDDDED